VGHEYFDEGSTADAPRWFMVDVGFVARFKATVSLDTLKQTPGLEEMMVIRKGSRLSVQPVTRAEYEIVRKLGRIVR
jgi:predicted RNA-binding protein with PUA-like domain